jgi:hypothetical protein
VATLTAGAAPARAQSCISDCDGNGRVAVAELVLAVNAALGVSEIASCPASDSDRDGNVTIPELLEGVTRSLSTCLRRPTAQGIEDATRMAEMNRSSIPRFLSLSFGTAGGDAGGALRGSRQARLAGGGAGQPARFACTPDDAGSGSVLLRCNAATHTLTSTYSDCRFPGSDALRNGVERRTVVVPDDPDFDLCDPNAEVPAHAIVTVELEGYSEISGSGGIRLANLTQKFEPEGEPCTSPTGERLANGMLTTNGMLHTFCNPEADPADCDASQADLRLTATALGLRQRHAAPNCDPIVEATGQLFVDNDSMGEHFAQNFLGLAVRERAAGDRRFVSQAGRVFVDCLGEVEYSNVDDLEIGPGAFCPMSGAMRIVIRTSGAPPAPAASPGGAANQASLRVPPNSVAASGGLRDLAYRAANGQVYQVLQNPDGNRELQSEDVQITTVVGSTDGISNCGSISTSQTQAQAVVSTVSGLAFPLEKVFVSPLIESTEQPCFNPNGRDGDGLLCFGAECDSSDCRCPGGGCDTFSLADLTSLSQSSLGGRAIEALASSRAPCDVTGRSTYGFATDVPTIDPGLCASRPDNGFSLAPRRTAVFAYAADPSSEFIVGAAGFPIDVNGDSNRCRSANTVVTGVATKNELGRALVMFHDGRVDFDANDDRVIERSLLSCQLLSAMQCGAPTATPAPTPNRPCPEFTSVQPQGSTADAFDRIGGASCGDGGNGSPERTFRFRAPEDGCYRFDTFGSDFDTVLYVRRGNETCQGPEIGCNDNADDTTLQSAVFFEFDREDPERGDTAVIVVDGNAGARGMFQLHVTRVGGTCPETTPTVTQTAEDTPTTTPTATAGATLTITPTITGSPSATGTATDTPSATLTGTETPTSTVTPTHTISPTSSPTPTYTLTPTRTPTRTPRFQPLANEFAVNEFTMNVQRAPAVGVHANGDFSIVWESRGQDGDSSGAFGRRFASSGQRVGAEFQVNSLTAGDQSVPAIAITGAGGFAVVWQTSERDGSAQGIFGRRFLGSGQPSGSEFQVNELDSGVQSYAAIASDAMGRFVVVWQGPGDGEGYGVFAQRFASSGERLGGKFQVNSFTLGYQLSAAVAAREAGDFTVVWQGYGDGGGYGVFGQRFGSSAEPLGTEFLVNTYTTGAQGSPSIAVDEEGAFVVIWSSAGQDGSGYGPFGQKFDSSGERTGGELQVHTFTARAQRRPAVASDPTGGFTVIWESARDGSGYGVFAQRLASSGVPLGTEFQVNSYTPNDQFYPRIGADMTGRFVVVWSSRQEGDGGFGIVARRLGLVP